MLKDQTKMTKMVIAVAKNKASNYAFITFMYAFPEELNGIRNGN